MEASQIVIIDMGGQYTFLIGRKLRELGVRSIILAPEDMDQWLASNHPKGIILSGGWASIYDANAPQISDSVLGSGIPILGICLGMHWLAHKFGGNVVSSLKQKEYYIRQFSRTVASDPLLGNIPERSVVLASHGDSVAVLPKGAYKSGKTPDCPIAAFSIPEKNIFAVQFHPECTESQQGKAILKNFLDICQTTQDWSPPSVIDQIRSEVLCALPGEAAVIHLFSGGVDSTVIAAILDPVMRDPKRERLICVTFDTGSLREGELREIRRNAVAAKCALHVIEAKQEFMAALDGLIDGQEKRLTFQRVYQKKVDEMKAMFKTPHVIQGTLAADLIESAHKGKAALINIHHNVGLGSLDPLRDLFKDEVRDLARFLGLPDFVSERMPFPGPGLFVRIIGVPVTEETLAIVGFADAQVRKIISRSGIEKEISQLIVAITIKTPGVKGDAPVMGYSILVRAVQSVDFMTGSGYEIPSSIRREIISALQQHPQILRIWWDEGGKPPQRFEFQ